MNKSTNNQPGKPEKGHENDKDLKIPPIDWKKIFADMISPYYEKELASPSYSKSDIRILYFWKGLQMEFGKSKNMGQALKYYQAGAELLDPCCSFRLCELYCNLNNQFQVISNFDISWYHLIISFTFIFVFETIELSTALGIQLQMQKLKRLADPELENSIARLQQKGPADSNIKNLIQLIFEYQILEDPDEIQVKYDEIFDQLQRNLKQGINRNISYQILFQIYCVQTKHSNKRVSEILDVLLLYPDLYLEILQQQVQVLRLLQHQSSINYFLNRVIFTSFEIFFIRKALALKEGVQPVAEADKLIFELFVTLDSIRQKGLIQELPNQIFVIRCLAQIYVMGIGCPVNLAEGIRLNKQELALHQPTSPSQAYSQYVLSSLHAKAQDADSQRLSSQFQQMAYKFFSSRLVDQEKNLKPDVFIIILSSYYMGRLELKISNDQAKARTCFQKVVEAYRQPSVLNSRTFQFEVIYRKTLRALKRLGENVDQVQNLVKSSQNFVRQQTYQSVLKKQQVDSQTNSKININQSILKLDPAAQLNSALTHSTQQTGQGGKLAGSTKPYLRDLDLQLSLGGNHIQIPYYKMMARNQSYSDESYLNELTKQTKETKDIVKVDIRQMQVGPLIRKGDIGNTHVALIRNELYAVKAINFLKDFDHHKLHNIIKNSLKINHPNLLNYLGYSVARPVGFTDCINYYLITDLKKSNLFTVLQYNYFRNLAQKLDVAIQIAKGLMAIHYSMMFGVHGNLKDTNILLSQSNKVFISDWAISKFLKSDTVNQQTDEVHFSLGFTAPEIYDSREEIINIQPQSDIWSFGVIMYQLFFGLNITLNVIQEKKFYGNPNYNIYITEAAPANQDSGTCEKLKQLIEKMLKKHPLERISMKDTLAELLVISEAFEKLQQSSQKPLTSYQ